MAPAVPKGAAGLSRNSMNGGNLFVIGQGQFEQLQRLIFRRGELPVFAVLDGAIIDDLPARLKQSAADAMCLFSGDLDPMLAAAAPYLVALQANAAITKMVLMDGWDEHWGIALTTDPGTDMRTLRSHLRRILRVKTPGGDSMLFRFYDPRAFRSVVPTFNQEQRNVFFGPIQSCHVEGRIPGSVLHFTRDSSIAPPLQPLAAAA